MKFADIPAHESVKERLRALVDTNHMPHALLLEGPEGIGKFALARALAQYIHCEHRTADGDSCGMCHSCRQHETFNHADTFFSFPILKGKEGNAISDDVIDRWKEYLSGYPYMNFDEWLKALDNPNGQPLIYSAESSNIIRKFSTTSYSTRFKILLMWLPERMQPDCANKLLKMIEEPMEDTCLIFVSNNPREILPTIYSRLQRIKIKRLPDSVISNYLIQKYSLAPSEANAIAHLAEGSIVKAEQQLSNTGESQRFLELFMQLMRNAYQRKIGILRKWSVDVAALGREGEMSFLSYCERMMRENFITNLNIPSLVYLNVEEQTFSSRFSPFINEKNVESLIHEFSAARADIGANGNAKIILFDLAIKVILLLK
jgi:DNA polymerase-3 subunit delta'